MAALVVAAPLALPGGAACGEPATDRATVVVAWVGDIRGAGSSSGLEIGLMLPDVDAAEVDAARIVVTRAVDDTGRDLVPEDSPKGAAALEPVQSQPAAGDGGGPLAPVVTARLRNPARRARVLAEIDGEVELYLPGRDPGAVATVPEIAALAGRPLENPALSAAGVSVVMLTGEQLAAEMKRQAEGRKEEARRHGVLGEMLESMASAFLKAFFTPEPGDILLKIDDPQGRVVRMVLLDPEGEDRTGSRGSQQGYAILSSAGGTPGAGWSLRVHLATPKAAEHRPFALRDVRLP